MTSKSYNFSTIRFSDLKSIVDIRLGSQANHLHKFDEWFMYAYSLSEKELHFLENLIQKNKFLLPSYSEEKLKVKFIGVILNEVDFANEQLQDWYDSSLSGFLNGVKIKGLTDFMIAKGNVEPETPYFFIQEFKPSIPDHNPSHQLLAEMLVAMEKNQTFVLRGGYIIGQIWKFVLLEKVGENKFEYYVSEAFDCLKINELKQIYINLQAVKHKYCQD
jgi:hypothetical protein